ASSLTRSPVGAFAPSMIQRSTVEKCVSLPDLAGGIRGRRSLTGTSFSANRSIMVVASPLVAWCTPIHAQLHGKATLSVLGEAQGRSRGVFVQKWEQMHLSGAAWFPLDFQ